MPLTTLQLNNTLAWKLQALNTGFAPTEQGIDNINANLQGVAVSTWNQLFAEQFSIAASGTATIDLTSFNNLVDEAVSLGHVLTLFMTVAGTNANVSLQKGASNGLVWFLGST